MLRPATHVQRARRLPKLAGPAVAKAMAGSLRR